MSYPTILPFAAKVLEEISHERGRQIAKHGNQSSLPDGTGRRHEVFGELDDLLINQGPEVHNAALARVAKVRTDSASHSEGNGSITFEHILTEEWAEAIAESDPALLRAELVQVAAVCVQWIEAIDGREVTA